MSAKPLTFSVLKFSYKPELNEHVNVALLFYNGCGFDLEYDYKFPLLNNRPEPLLTHLKALRAIFKTTPQNGLITLLEKLSPQFKLGADYSISSDELECFKTELLSNSSQLDTHRCMKTK